MGYFGVTSSVAFAVTPVIGLTIYRNMGPAAMFAVASVMGGIAFTLSLLIREHYHAPARQTPTADSQTGFGERIRGLLRGPLMALMLLPSAINPILLLGNSAVQSFLINCGLSRGLERIALFTVVNQVAVIVTRLMLGRLLAKLSKETCVFAGILIAAAGTALVAISHDMGTMLAAAVLIGVGLTAVTQLLQAQTLTTTPPERRGLAGTVFMLMGNIGTGVGAALLGAVTTAHGVMPRPMPWPAASPCWRC